MKKPGIIFALAFVTLFVGIGIDSVAQAADGKFVAVEVGGAKFWLGGGDIDFRSSSRTLGPFTITLINKMDADHGFAIDALGVKQVVKAGEEVTISVSSVDVNLHDDRVLKFYCHLHPAHVGGTIVVLK